MHKGSSDIMKYTIYSPNEMGYLTNEGLFSPWHENAREFESIDHANSIIVSSGFMNNTNADVARAVYVAWKPGT